MKHSIRSAFALAAAAFCLTVATAFAQEERPTKAITLDWQRDIDQFVTYLKGIAAEAIVPTEDDLKTRMEDVNGGLEVITDGYGGVVDFNAAKGTVQQVVTEKFAGGGSGPTIVWEFELAQDANASWDKSMVLTPKLAENAGEKRKEGGQRFFQIRIAKSDGGLFRAGDRVSLESSIDDFSRFRKDFSKATGLVAIYYLEESPNPVFLLKLSDAKINSIKPKPGEHKAPPVDRSDPEAVAKAFITAIANNDVKEASQFVIAENRDEISKEMAKGIPPLPSNPKIEVRVKDNRSQADVRVLNAKPAAPGNAPFGLDMRLSNGKWWIVK